MSINSKHLAIQIGGLLLIPIIGGSLLFLLSLSKNDKTKSNINHDFPEVLGSLAPRNGSPEILITKGFDPNARQALTVDDLFDGGTRKRQTKKNKKRKTTKRKTK
jgi:hypothetical protein